MTGGPVTTVTSMLSRTEQNAGQHPMIVRVPGLMSVSGLVITTVLSSPNLSDGSGLHQSFLHVRSGPFVGQSGHDIQAFERQSSVNEYHYEPWR